jgi:hypothetical protein
MKSLSPEKELEQELAKRDRIHQRQTARWGDGTRSRARTTTANAELGRCNERIAWLRQEIKAANQ